MKTALGGAYSSATSGDELLFLCYFGRLYLCCCTCVGSTCCDSGVAKAGFGRLGSSCGGIAAARRMGEKG